MKALNFFDQLLDFRRIGKVHVIPSLYTNRLVCALYFYYTSTKRNIQYFLINISHIQKKRGRIRPPMSLSDIAFVQCLRAAVFLTGLRQLLIHLFGERQAWQRQVHPLGFLKRNFHIFNEMLDVKPRSKIS